MSRVSLGALGMLQLAGRVLDRLHSALARGAFAACGARTRIERGARLVAPHLVVLGEGVNIGDRAWLNAKDDRGDGQPVLRVGDGSYIGRFTQINAWRDVHIGREVLVADRVLITDADHVYTGDAPIIRQGDVFRAPVRLEDGCWIGIGAVILPGVTVGRNAVIAANAVVTVDVPAFSVVGGIPARILKTVQQKA